MLRLRASCPGRIQLFGECIRACPDRGKSVDFVPVEMVAQVIALLSKLGKARCRDPFKLAALLIFFFSHAEHLMSMKRLSSLRILS